TGKLSECFDGVAGDAKRDGGHGRALQREEAGSVAGTGTKFRPAPEPAEREGALGRDEDVCRLEVVASGAAEARCVPGVEDFAFFVAGEGEDHQRLAGISCYGLSVPHDGAGAGEP